MKKIMFNDRYGLTQAVLEGRKTMTRRIITCPETRNGIWVAGFHVYTNPNTHIQFVNLHDEDERDIDGGQLLPKYKVGEIVAIAQNYQDAGVRMTSLIDEAKKGTSDIDEAEEKLGKLIKGRDNKMFVRADLMPYRIQITSVKAERLQDISDEDCFDEGIFSLYYDKELYSTPRQAFAALIDRVSGKGTWDSNPWVWAYEFQLVD